MTDIPGPALLSSITENSSAKGPLQTTIAPPAPSGSPFSGFTSPPPISSKSSTPQPPNYQSSLFAPPPKSTTDPFAALASPSAFSSKPSTPAHVTQAFQPPAPAATAADADDDEWAFSSALPPEAAPQLPQEQKAVLADQGLKIELIAKRPTPGANSVRLHFAFSNNTAQPLSELHFQSAVPKVCPHRGVLSLISFYDYPFFRLHACCPCDFRLTVVKRDTNHNYNLKLAGICHPSKAVVSRRFSKCGTPVIEIKRLMFSSSGGVWHTKSLERSRTRWARFRRSRWHDLASRQAFIEGKIYFISSGCGEWTHGGAVGFARELGLT